LEAPLWRVPGPTREYRRRTGPEESEGSLFGSLTSIRAAWVYLSAGWLYGLPLGIPLSPTGVDPSWQAALGWAAELHLTHGRDLVFTYGPLGYLFNPVFGAHGPVLFTFLIRVVARTGIALYFALETRSAMARGQPSIIPVFAFSLALALAPTNDLAAVFLVLVLTQATAHSAWLPCALAGLASGLLLLAKFNNGIQCLSTLAVLAIAGALQRRRPAGLVKTMGAAAGGLAVAILACWMTGSVAPVPFLTDSWRLASSYSQLSLGRPAEELIAFTSLLFLGALFLQALHPTHWRDQWLILACLPAGFLCYKSALVRADDLHVAWGAASFIALWSGASLRLSSPALAGQVRIAVVVGGVMSLLSAEHVGLASLRAWQVQVLDVTRALLPNMEPLSPLAPQTPARLWASIPQGTVDVYPNELGELAPVPQRWRPRYVFQAYANLHPVLDRKAAAQLRSGQGADWILFSLETVGMSHVAFTDVAGWNALSRHYEVGPDSNDLTDSLWLKRRDEPPALEVTTREGTWPHQQWVNLPETDDVVRLSLQIRQTLPGKLLDVLFKVYPPVMDVEFTDGELRSYRFNWRNAANGMIVSHVPRTRAESKAWFSGTLSRNVRRVRIVRFSRAFAPEVPLQWTIERSLSSEERSER